MDAMSEGLNFQHFLDGVVDAFRARDFAAFEERMALPLTVFSYEGTAVVTDPDDLRHYFAIFIENLMRVGVTDHVRIATSFYQIGPNLASCTYDTYLFRDGQRVTEPYASATTLRLDGGRWRVVSIMSAIPQARSWFRKHSIDALTMGRAARAPAPSSGAGEGAPPPPGDLERR